MFSYQHEFHAGNSADILKHVALTFILDSLCKKDKPFTVIDSHAGAGRFNLDDERSLKTGEAEAGIKRLAAQCKTVDAEKIPAPIVRYLQLQAPYLEQNRYAGSPEIERLVMRNTDKLFLVEKHPAAIESLTTNMKLPVLSSDGKTNESKEKYAGVSYTIRAADSYDSLAALTPPLIKRGLIITDPSYEEESDYRAVTDALRLAHKKWNTAIIALWYPLLTRKQNLLSQMLISLEDDAKLGTNQSDFFKVEFLTAEPQTLEQEAGAHLYGSGMFIMNPPWQMEEEMARVVSFLTALNSKDVS